MNPKRQVEATKDIIEEITNLSDKDAEEALNKMRCLKQFIRKQGGLQMNVDIRKSGRPQYGQTAVTRPYMADTV